MKVHEFDINKGIYKFELDEIQTEIHSHPAFEIMFSRSGGIELEIENCKYRNIALAIIEPHKPHKVKYQKDKILVLMIECNGEHLQKLLSKFDILLSKGIYVDNQTNDITEIIEEIVESCYNSNIPIVMDERIQKCLNFLNTTSSDYKTIIKELKLRTHLSDSRLSHLFKEEIGTSIKKYFVWSKLKKAFDQVVRGEKNMYEASIENGFYDQAHLSKAFKQMLGISPSDVYNSRMLQV